MVAPAPVKFMLPDGTLFVAPQVPLPKDLSGHAQSWDMAFKDTKDAAYVVGQVWAQKKADSFLLDQVRDKMDIVKTLEAVKTLSKLWPQAIPKYIEDKANGIAVMGMLQKEVPGLDPVQPNGGKEARANAAAPVCKSGNVYLPHPALFAWVKGLVAELETFPGGKFADQVDTLTQYLNKRYGTIIEYGYTPAPKSGGPLKTKERGIL